MIKFKVERSWSRNGFDIWLLEYRNNQGYVAKPITIEFEKVKEGQMLPEPSLHIGLELAMELIPQMKKQLAGLTVFDEKEVYETSVRIEKAMQDHIDSLKLIVNRVVK